MTEHLPILQVVVPMIAAPVCFLLRKPRLTRYFTLLCLWVCLGIAVVLLQRVQAEGTISYALGGWPPPWGIEIRIDLLNAYVALIVTTIAAVVLAFGNIRSGVEIPEGKAYLFYAAVLLVIAGLLGMAVTGDAFNVFVFLEISSLASYTLIALGKKREAKTAAFNYLIIGTIGGTFILLGFGLLYQMTGTLNMMDLAERLPPVLGTRTIFVAFAFLAVGVSIKLALFPLHQWLPNAYAYAPPVVSALLAATATKVSFYILVRLVFTVFGAEFVFGSMQLHAVLLPVAILAMFTGSISAIYQTDLKRLLAYSSIAQIGYMVLGLGLANEAGLTGGLVHLFNHALMKGGLFLVVACIVYRVGSSSIGDLKGLGKRMPWTTAAFVLGGLALVGVPATAGFISKWYLVLGSLERGWYAVAVLIVLSSLLALVYVWKIVEIAYFEDPDPEKEKVKEAPLSMLIPTWLLIAATVYFGIHTDLTAGVARSAAALLLGVQP